MKTKWKGIRRSTALIAALLFVFCALSFGIRDITLPRIMNSLAESPASENTASEEAQGGDWQYIVYSNPISLQDVTLLSGTANLNKLLTGAALLDEDGNVLSTGSEWTIQPDRRYQVRLSFQETPGDAEVQFAAEPVPLVYQLPEGLTAGAEDAAWPVRIQLDDGASIDTTCSYHAMEQLLSVAGAASAEASEQLTAAEAAALELVIPVDFAGAPDALAFSEQVNIRLIRTSGEPLTAEGPDYLIRVWPMGETVLPKGAVLTAAEIENHQPYEEQVLSRIGIEAQNLESLRVFDLAILADGAKVEPNGPVRVEIRMPVTGERVAVMHFPDPAPAPMRLTDGKRTLGAKRTQLSPAEEMPAAVSDGVISFETDSFSAYAVVGYRLERLVIASDGVAYLISVTYTEDARIPEGSELATRELLPDDPRYADFLAQSAQAMGCAPEELTHSRLFDISILSPEGEPIEPAAPVQVRVEYADPLALEGAQSYRVVHITEDGTELLVPVTGGADGQVDSFTFNASSFSLYGIVSTGATTDLDGKTFALIRTNNGTALCALQSTARNSTRLSALSVTEQDGYLNAAGDLELWTFISKGNGQYWIQASDGKYLNINGTTNNNGAVCTSDTAQALNVTPGTGNYAGMVRITNANGLAINLYSGSPGEGFGPYNDSGPNEWFTLYDASQMKGPFNGQKISVQNMEDAQQVMIYRSVYNQANDTFTDYIIDGNGQLVPAYDKGDQLTLYSAVSPVWVVTFHRDEVTGELNGYYDFYNEETGMYLSPLGDGTLVSAARPGVTLNGRRDGAYTSTIESWDSSNWAWYGYHIDGTSLSTAKSGSTQAFSFAAVQMPSDTISPVSTVDSTSAGITIRMFDYDNRDQISNVTGSNNYDEGVLPKTHVKVTLGADGYPVFTNNKSGSALFSPSTSYYKGSGNHLFLSSVYNSTGYYEYNAFHNFAHYNAGSGSFTVYQAIGTPSNGDNFYFKRGNFFPFNDLDPSRKATNTNQYSGSGTNTELDIQDPTKGTTLYMINEPDYYFGMTMEATFMQPKDGQQDGQPVLYEFNGDDDLWIFIDGVLILDIGGVHDAWPGTINFATGAIHSTHGGAGRATTIKQAFKNAGVFPDGTPWNDARADVYFKGDTFVDYSSHIFKMFYMEHGAGASNLEMRFNLPVIEKGRFTVEKKLQGTDQQRFTNVSFAYQAFTKDAAGHDVPITTGAVYEGTHNPLSFYNGVHIGGNVYNNVFYLKPGEAATFPEMVEETEYWVRELGIGLDYYDKVEVNDVYLEGEELTEKDGVYPTSVATIAQRARVIYGNRCADKNKNELRITKRITEESTDDGTTFEFRVMLENPNGDLVPYSTGSYMIQNDDGEYFHYVNGVLTSNGYTPIVASVAGNNGTIAGIPVGYTVVIADLLAGTDFYVEEIRIPDGWVFHNKAIADYAQDEPKATGKDFSNKVVPSDGQIALGKDAKVTILNRQILPVTVQISGVKVLKGRDMAAGEFVFTMTPVNLSGEAIGTAMTARNQAGDNGAETSFSFPELRFDMDDYRQAVYRDADGSALFYYVVQEQISENADEEGFDQTQGLIYDLSQYLVVIRITLDSETQELHLTRTVYPYDDHGVPTDLRPRENTVTASAGSGTPLLAGHR